MGVPRWLQTVRSLRPTHVLAALPRGSPLLLLNPRDLRRADTAPVPRLTLPSTLLADPVLRAARAAGAVLGVMKPSDPSSASQFAAMVFHAASEMDYGAPFFLGSPPLPFRGGEIGGAQLRSEIQRYLDAGFTEITLGTPEPWPADAVAALREALPILREREIPLALSAPDAGRAGPAIADLRSAGLAPEVVILPASPSESERATLGDVGLELPVGSAMNGLRGLDLSRPLEAIAAPLLAQTARGFDPKVRSRAEALTYAELLRLLNVEPMRGAAARTVRVLSEQPGY